MINVFVSYCSDDNIIENFNEFERKINFDCEFFNTGDNKNTTQVGADLQNQLRDKLSECDFMLSFVTDSYIRSTICIAEIFSFWYQNKKVIPIVFGKSKNTIGFLNNLFGNTFLYINLTDEEIQKNGREKTLKKATIDLKNAFTENGITSNLTDETYLKIIHEFLEESNECAPKRPYIGSYDIFDKNIGIKKPSYGIFYFDENPMEYSYSLSKLCNMKNIYIVATTGQSLIHTITDSTNNYLLKMLENGTNVYVLIPNLYSDFASDVAHIEEKRITSFAEQFSDVIENLTVVLKRLEHTKKENCGKIFVGSTHNLLRQTVVMGESDNDSFGWIATTMPPGRTATKTLTIGFEGDISGDTFAKTVHNHVMGIVKIAKKENHLFELTEESEFEYGFYLEKETAKRYWSELYEIAQRNMNSTDDDDPELIEVAAQHPLKNGRKPALEFRKRLDRAVLIYNEIKAQNNEAKIYVPGSRHMNNGVCDEISLSNAGKNYLIEKGIPEIDILGEKENNLYKGEKGVYNSADECFVASKIFLNGDYSKLHCICSSNQMMRKKLFYIAFGVIPLFSTVDTTNLAHNFIYEVFDSLPNVIFNDHTWQDEDSFNGCKTREERIPNDSKPYLTD